LKRLLEKKRDNPSEHESTEHSKYLSLKYDLQTGTMPSYKRKEYEKLKKKYDQRELEIQERIEEHKDDIDEVDKFMEEK